MAGERLLADKIINTMFSGSDELYDVTEAKVQPNVITWTLFTGTPGGGARPAVERAAESGHFSGSVAAAFQERRI